MLDNRESGINFLFLLVALSVRMEFGLKELYWSSRILEFSICCFYCFFFRLLIDMTID